MSDQSWTVAEAKAKFSEVIESARESGPQTITKNGRTAAIVVSPDEWRRRTERVGTLALANLVDNALARSVTVRPAAFRP